MSRHLGPLCVAIALAVGIALAPTMDGLAISQFLRWLAAIACAAIAVRRPTFVLAAALFAGLAHGSRTEGAPSIAVDDRTSDRATGTIAGPSVPTARGFGALLVDDRGDRIWLSTTERLESGERVRVEGIARSARPSSGPALPDRADALLARGAHVELTARRVHRLGDAAGVTDEIWRWAGAQQRAWAQQIDRATGAADPAARAALAGIVVGVRREIPPALDERWRRSGIYHVLSVSGLHLAVIAGLVFWLARRLVAASPWGHRGSPARWAAPPAFGLALAYTLVTGAQVATVRALVVVAIVLVAAMLDRPVRLVDALGVAALALLAWRPAELFDPGFQLSFAATLALAVSARHATERRGVLGWIARGLAASTWIAIATAPITAYHFQHVMPAGVVGNLVLGPLLELVALPLALGGLVLGWDAPVAIAVWIVELVDAGATIFAEHAIVGRVALVGPALLALLVALSLVLASRVRRTRVDVVLWLALCLGWAAGREPPPADALRVTFVDVGQGDAAIVELPDGEVWLVDAGGHSGARDPSAPGRAIDRVLAAYGRDRVALAIVSHPHPDHFAGLAGMATPIDELWIAPEPEPTIEHARFAVATASLPRGRPANLARAGVELVVWWPRYEGHGIAADPVRGVNDNSLVVELRYRGRSILFTGDLEAEGEAALVDEPFGPFDVVKVPHHGSRTSSSAAFVAATRPRLAVISCGVANAFDFPAPEVVARWRSAGADVLSTDLHGSITVTIDGAGDLRVETALDREFRSLP